MVHDEDNKHANFQVVSKYKLWKNVIKIRINTKAMGWAMIVR